MNLPADEFAFGVEFCFHDGGERRLAGELKPAICAKIAEAVHHEPLFVDLEPAHDVRPVTDDKVGSSVDHRAGKERQIAAIFAKKDLAALRYALGVRALGSAVKRDDDDIGFPAGLSDQLASAVEVDDANAGTGRGDPRSLVPQSIMPGYPFLTNTELSYDDIAAELKANRSGGVPYSDEMIERAMDDLRAQATPDHPGQSAFEKRYPKAQARDFDGNPKRISEADALIAYLQMLGTLVDFKLYNDKANIR